MERLSELRKLALDLRAAIDEGNPRTMAGLARQYRETLREIAELEADDDGGGDIDAIIGKHADDRK